MDGIQTMGKLIITLGALMIIVGVLMYFGGKIGIGRMPGDFVYKRGNFVAYFPLATSVLLSIILTIIFALLKSKK
ncbi:UNVERIFIED_CONTAM: Protein of unknown function (DUF2905) [Acetivibrio alkalicellulosi]